MNLICQESSKILQNQQQVNEWQQKWQNIVSSQSNILQDIDDNMASAEQLALIDQKLSSLGIIVTQDLKSLLHSSAITCNGVLKLLQSNELEKQYREQERNAELRVAGYQGLENACQFVYRLATHTQSNNLAKMASLAQAGVQIYRATEQIINAGANFTLALLNPYAAIANAGLTIFSLFNSSNTVDTNQIILKQLAQIHQDLQEFHQEIAVQFVHVDERLVNILDTVTNGFNRIEVTMTVSLTRQLSEIQSELATLSNITRVGFEDVLLTNLNETINYIRQLKSGVISHYAVNYDKYITLLNKLHDSISRVTSSRLFTGDIYQHLLQPTIGNTLQLIKVLQYADNSSPSSLLSLLAAFGKYHLKITELQTINETKLFHPEIWYLALEAYKDLKYFSFSEFNYEYDPNNTHLLEFYAQAKNVLDFIKILQSNSDIYTLLFSKIIQLNDIVLQTTSAFYPEAQGVHKSVIDKISAEMTTHTALPKVNINYLLPSELQNRPNAVEKTKAFFQKGKALLTESHIRLPPEFIYAANLGLGYFECSFHFPHKLYKKHHRHGFRLKASGKSGFEIIFNLRGDRMQLFSPGMVKKPMKGVSLEEIYNYLIKRTITSPQLTQFKNIIMERIIAHHLDIRKNLAKKIEVFLSKPEGYPELLKNSHFLLAYLHCAGFDRNFINDVANKLPLENIIDNYTNYSNNADSKTPFPTGLKTNNQEIMSLALRVQADIQQAKIGSKGIHDHSLVANHIQKGILLIYEMRLRSYSRQPHNILQQASPRSRVAFFSSPSTVSGIANQAAINRNLHENPVNSNSSLLTVLSSSIVQVNDSHSKNQTAVRSSIVLNNSNAEPTPIFLKQVSVRNKVSDKLKTPINFMR